MAVAPPPPPGPEHASEGFPRWPLWLPLAGLGCGLAFGILALGVLQGAVGADPDAPGIVAAGTVVIDVSIVVATLAFASLVAPPRPWQLGLRGAPLKFTLSIAAMGVGAFFLFSLLYGLLIRPEAQQDVIDQLGADRNTLLLVLGALVVLVVAPVCEELFFRGFLYRVLRLRMGMWIAGVLDGVVFGLVHASGTSFVALPVLAFLGLVFCYVYERTGTLYATIALHCLNNTISYAVGTDDGWAVSLAVGGSLICACLVAIARTPARAAA
jgi:uncharacterized protein